MCGCMCVKCVANVEKFRESTENPFLKKKTREQDLFGKREEKMSEADKEQKPTESEKETETCTEQPAKRPREEEPESHSASHETASTEDKDKKETKEEDTKAEVKAEEEPEPEPEPETVTCSHILVKHVGSRRPSSWREARITRTRDHARQRIEKLRRWVVEGKATFEQVAQHESDCSSARRGGDLGPFRRGTMMRPFEDAAFRLRVGELSDVVETDSGFHIIKRTA